MRCVSCLPALWLITLFVCSLLGRPLEAYPRPSPPVFWVCFSGTCLLAWFVFVVPCRLGGAGQRTSLARGATVSIPLCPFLGERAAGRLAQTS